MIFEIFYTLLVILIFSRILMPFFGMNHGQLYDNIYFYSEKILAPIRKILPRSQIDWSPFAALLILNLIRSFLLPLVGLIVQGNFRGAVFLTFLTLLSLLSTILSFFIIVIIVKIVNDKVKGHYVGLTHFLNTLTYKPIIAVKQFLPENLKKHTIWVILVLLIILKLLTERAIEISFANIY